ncbi:enoyl-CoA hydratase [Spirochaetota bacterium]
MGEAVLFEKENGIATITLNRPERHNAINQDLLVNLYNCIDEVAASDNIRVAIITGNGKSFCSGLDLEVIGKDKLFEPRGDGMDYPDIIGKCKKPIIGAINGNAITGGFEIALNCDFLIASEQASFADTHAKVGIHPGWGLTQLLQQAVGQRMAKQISLTCQFISAQEAFRVGLVNEVVEEEKLMPRAMEIAKYITETKPEIFSKVKELIEFRNNTTLSEAYANERKGFREFYMKFMSG